METHSFVVGEGDEPWFTVSFADAQSVSHRYPGDETNSGRKANSGDKGDARGETITRGEAPVRNETPCGENDEHATPTDTPDANQQALMIRNLKAKRCRMKLLTKQISSCVHAYDQMPGMLPLHEGHLPAEVTFICRIR